MDDEAGMLEEPFLGELGSVRAAIVEDDMNSEFGVDRFGFLF